MRLSKGVIIWLESGVDTPSGPVIDSRCPTPSGRLRRPARFLADARAWGLCTRKVRSEMAQVSSFVATR